MARKLSHEPKARLRCRRLHEPGRARDSRSSDDPRSPPATSSHHILPPPFDPFPLSSIRGLHTHISIITLIPRVAALFKVPTALNHYLPTDCSLIHSSTRPLIHPFIHPPTQSSTMSTDTTPPGSSSAAPLNLRDSVCERPQDTGTPDFGLFREGKKLCVRCVLRVLTFRLDSSDRRPLR